MRRALSVLCWGLLVGCSWQSSQETLDVTVVGTPKDVFSRPVFSGLLREAHLMVDEQDVPWLALTPTPTSVPDADTVQVRNLYRLIPPFDGYRVQAHKIDLPPMPAHALCTQRQAPGGDWWVSLQRPSMPLSREYLAGSERPEVLCGQSTLVHYPYRKDNTSLSIIRKDERGQIAQIDMPWPTGANPLYDQGPRYLDHREQVLFATDGDYHTLAYFLAEQQIVDLGTLFWGFEQEGLHISIDFNGDLWVFDLASRAQFPIQYSLSAEGNLLGYVPSRREVLVCGPEGLLALRIPRQGEPPRAKALSRVLDPTPCVARTSTLPIIQELAYYSPNGTQPDYELRAVRVDGSAPPRVVFPHLDESVAGYCGDRFTVYRHDSIERYGIGVSDGWIKDRQIFERGRDLRISNDCSYLFFKEYTANIRRLGELRALSMDRFFRSPAELPFLRLGHNVGMLQLAPDGRLLAGVDLAVVGSHNQLQLIDVERRVAQSILFNVNAATRALFLGTYLPGNTQALVEVKDSLSGGAQGLVLIDLPPPVHP
jgi:hypothetical protein